MEQDLIDRELKKKIAKQALVFARPLILACLAGIGKRQDLCIVVVDADGAGNVPLVSYRDYVLATDHYGVPDKWEFAYGDIANNKACLTWLTEDTTREILDAYAQDLPAYLKSYGLSPDFEFYPGSAIGEHFIVGTSGVQSQLDEAISRIVAALADGMYNLHHLIGGGKAEDVLKLHALLMEK